MIESTEWLVYARNAVHIQKFGSLMHAIVMIVMKGWF